MSNTCYGRAPLQLFTNTALFVCVCMQVVWEHPLNMRRSVFEAFLFRQYQQFQGERVPAQHDSAQTQSPLWGSYTAGIPLISLTCQWA